MFSVKALIVIFLSIFSFSNAEAKSVLGQWGGDNVSLWATASGADAELHCSFGRVSGPIETDAQGNFSVVGYVDYYDGTPPMKKIAASYVGSITRVKVEDDDDYDLMKLTVSLADGESWDFELRQDELGTAHGCRK